MYNYDETHGETRKKVDPNRERPSTVVAVSLWSVGTHIFIVIFTTFCVGKSVVNLKSEKAQRQLFWEFYYEIAEPREGF